MDANELPTDVEQLKALFVSTLAAKEQELQQARLEATQFKHEATQFKHKATQFKHKATQFKHKATQFKHEASELSTTVAEQEKKLAAGEQTIKELLAALRGKTRERIDPDQLLLFEIGELETLIEESLTAEKPASPKRKRLGDG